MLNDQKLQCSYKLDFVVCFVIFCFHGQSKDFDLTETVLPQPLQTDTVKPYLYSMLGL